MHALLLIHFTYYHFLRYGLSVYALVHYAPSLEVTLLIKSFIVTSHNLGLSLLPAYCALLFLYLLLISVAESPSACRSTYVDDSSSATEALYVDDSYSAAEALSVFLTYRFVHLRLDCCRGRSC